MRKKNEPIKAWGAKFQHVLLGEITYGVYVGKSRGDVEGYIKNSRPGTKLVRVEVREVRRT